MTTPIDPGRASILDPVALAKEFGRMSDEALEFAEQTFCRAAEGWHVRLTGGDFVQFGDAGRLIALSIARIIAAHREQGVPFLGELERLSARVGLVVAASDEINGLEATFALAPQEPDDNGREQHGNQIDD